MGKKTISRYYPFKEILLVLKNIANTEIPTNLVVRFGLYADDKEEDQKNLHGALKLYMKK